MRVRSQKTRQALLVVGEALDPAELPEKLQLYDADGAPLSLGGYPRESRFYATAMLADEASESGVFSVWPGWRAMKAETNVPARVRLYATEAQAIADADRNIGTDPTGNHGLLFELVTTPEVLAYTLSPKVDISSDDAESSDYYIIVTNMSGAPAIVTATFNLVRTE